MAITSLGLMKLGFSLSDFELHNNSDGTPTVISEWYSAQPRPSEAEIEIAHAEWQIEHEAESAQKAADKASANAKLKVLGLTDAEIEAIL